MGDERDSRLGMKEIHDGFDALELPVKCFLKSLEEFKENLKSVILYSRGFQLIRFRSG